MKKIIIVFISLFAGPAMADFEGMCGLSGYTGFNATYIPYAQSEFDMSSLESGDTFTCTANTRRVFNARFVPNEYDCAPGEYVPANSDGCVVCPADSYCPGGHYVFNETETQGITACAPGLYAPTGMWESAQCGRILHIGDEVVYLRSTQKTTPALHVDIDNDGVADFFGNVITLDVPMTNGTQRKLKLSYGGQTYSVYDDSVDLTQYQNE